MPNIYGWGYIERGRDANGREIYDLKVSTGKGDITFRIALRQHKFTKALRATVNGAPFEREEQSCFTTKWEVFKAVREAYAAGDLQP